MALVQAGLVRVRDDEAIHARLVLVRVVGLDVTDGILVRAEVHLAVVLKVIRQARENPS